MPSSVPSCQIPTSSAGGPCGRPLVDGALLPCCAGHLRLAAESLQLLEGAGIEDTLAAPCVLCSSRLGVRYPSGILCAVCEWRVGDLPDAELPPPRVDVVYYIRFDDRIKIGTSANPRQRLHALWHDELLAFERGDRALERRRHEQFRTLRLERTEWFTAAPELEAHIDTFRAGVADPWQQHLRWISEAVASRG